MTQSRKYRGYQTEHLACSYLRERVWPHASVHRGPGRDLENTPGVGVEVKARRGFNPLAWSRQAAANAGDDLAMVVVRPNGMGEASLAQWPVFFRFEDAVRLLLAAGYGGWEDGRDTEGDGGIVPGADAG